MRLSDRYLATALKVSFLFFMAGLPAMAQSVTGACLYALDPSAQRAFSISGSTAVYTACGVVVESNASQAFEMEGSETLYLQNHAQVGVVGNSQFNGNKLIDAISNQQVQAVSITSPGDPLASIQVPTQGTIVGKSHISYDMNNRPPNNTLSPGVYCGGLTVGNTNGAQFAMGPGTYIMAGGGLTVNSQAIISGSGVTVYNTSSAGWGCSGNFGYTPITISGQASVTLSAPVSGSLAGILLFGNRTGCSTVGSCQDQINGGSSGKFSGALYFKSDKLLFSGASGNGSCLVAVADMITINGNSSFGSSGCAINPISVSIAPLTATLYSGQTQQFSASVTNSNNPTAMWSISPTGAGSISSSGLYTAPPTLIAPQTVTITATSQADTSKLGTATITLAVHKTTPTITWSTPAPIAYSTALSATQLDATASVAGTFAYTPPAGTVLAADLQTLTVTFTPTNTTSYNLATASVSLAVNKATPVIAWATPAPITYGTALSATQLNATASVTGAFGYSPVSGTVLTAGAQTLSVTFTPTDTTDYRTATATVLLTVSQATPVITWLTPAPITYGTALSAMQLDATASVTGAFGYTPVSGTVLTAGAQTLSVTFTPTDTTNYKTNTATVLLTVSESTPVITWITPAPITYGTALSAMQLDATTSVAGAFAYAPVSGTVLAAGTQTVSLTFTPSDTTDYNSAKATATLSVNQATPTITWAPPATITYGAALSATQLNATASVPGTLIYSPAMGMVPSTGAQTLSVTFTPTDVTDYIAATATVTLTVNSPPVSVTVTPPTALLNSGQAQQFTATVANTPNTAVTWSINQPGIGSISASGLYTAPAVISTQQTLIVTATSQADTTQSASAAVSLSPGQCTSNGYSHARAIVVDHTKVPNADQANFPFLFNTSDPTLASIANGGHVTNPNGYDIIFTADPNGQTKLDYELEDYNPATGHVIAWVRIPTLSHITDTTVYLFYGNAGITHSQQNPTGVWDANYMGVWHVPNGNHLSLADSSGKGNNAVNNGAMATAGQIDGGMQTNGSTYATLGTPASLANLAQGNATYSAWVNAAQGSGGIIMGKDDANVSSGWTLGLNASNNVDFSVVFNGSNFSLLSTRPVGDGTWTYIVVTLAGSPTQSQATIYINGTLSGTGSGGSAQTNDDSAQIAYLANATFGDQATTPLNGSEDEFRISNAIRSADWIATEYSNQNAPATFYRLSPEDVEISPVSATLYSSQSQHFAASALNSCAGSITWSIDPAGSGALTGTGFYTAPADIATQRTVTITATSPTDLTKSASATVTLMPPVAVSVTPATVTLIDGDQQQQFAAGVIDTSNPSVTWTINPAGMGIVNSTGLYTAPSTIPEHQTVTVTATSQADLTKSASAIITLAPPTLPAPVCASNGYSYVRAIVINHSRVPNTDQANFPFLFDTTDPAFATTVNGGHIANFNGYDIMFSADPSGQTQLSYELEEYNPITGHVIAWVRIPTLSHTSDTILYVFYGNPSTASSQQTPTSVWDSNYLGVWHVQDGNQLSLADSTSNGDNGTDNGATPTAGQVDGGMQTNGYTNAILGARANLANLGHGNATFSAWVSSTGSGGMVEAKAGPYEGGWALGLNGINTPQLFLYDADSPLFDGNAPVSGGWNYVVATVAQSTATPSQSQVSLYVNGIQSGSGTATFTSPVDDTAFPAYLSSNNYGESSIVGAEDEFRISNINRSPDWITSEYNNQSSPSSFYSLYSENLDGVVPTTDTLYASQSEQLAVIAVCAIPAVTWSMPSGAPGALSASGLYTAPASIVTRQGVTVTATSQADGSTVGSATLTLMPPLTVSVSPSAPTLYGSGETLQFTANLTNATNTAVTWSVNPSGQGTIDSIGIYTAPSFNTSQRVTITATSKVDPTKSASATVTLVPILVTPSYSWTRGGFTQQYTASVPVSWSLIPVSGGTISASGLFTAANVSWGQYEYVTIKATSLVDPNGSGRAGIIVYPAAKLTPLTATLFGGQTLEFSACMSATSNSMECGPSVAAWSISPAGAGTITSSGTYTAPMAVPTSQAVVITATDLFNPAIAVYASVTLIPPGVSISPGAATLYGGQTEQFFAHVATSSNTDVSWSIAPARAGSITDSGFYAAPIGITSQQTVTITAVSKIVPTLSASAVVTLSPTQCVAKVYSYVRSIAIDHTKVPNTDQKNFPFLFSATDPAFASVANNGHIASPSGNDILFSSDTAGINRLDYEIEEYNPVTGRILAWVRIPTLTHDSDTVIYMFYGNSSVSASQQNPGGVWDSNYQSVYHLAKASSGTALDSTGYGKSVTTHELASALGEIDSASGFNGTTSYFELPPADFASYPVGGQYSSSFSASFGVWFKTSSEGVILGQTGSWWMPGSSPYGDWFVPALYVDSTGSIRGSLFKLENSKTTYYGMYGSGVSYTSAPQLVTQAAYNDNRWHFAALTYGNGSETLYVDGQTIGTEQNAVQSGYTSPYVFFVGTGYDPGWANVSTYTGWDYFNGALEEVEVSDIARSGDWLQAEYFNQSSPATFFALSSEVNGNVSLSPLTSSLYARQNQKFTVLERTMCGTVGAVWSMPAGSPGVLSSEGLYTAPRSIDVQHQVKITATTLGETSTSITATVTLLPPVTITVTPPTMNLTAGQSQQFTAVVNNTNNTAASWTISPAGEGTITTLGLYTAPVSATVQTVAVTATSVADRSQSASATITLAVAGPVGIRVAPPSAVLYGGQTQQLTAIVSNTSNTSVTWTIDPAGVGAVSSSGQYTAPGAVTAQQTVTVTATSQANSSLSAWAMITLVPAPCASSGYSYQRIVVIDHTKVPSTDQTNFPILFNTTDPTFSSQANGGHVSSPSGSDIIFSTDPNGLTKLDHDLERYDPVTGQVVAWVRIPSLSHTVDTTLYVFYGNPNIAAPQQNPGGVWDTGYKAVYHFADASSGMATDSTANGNNGIVKNSSLASGEIAEAAAFDGATSFIQVPTADFPVYPGQSSTTLYPLSFGGWFRTASGGVILGQTDGTQPGGGPNGWVPALYVDTAGSLRASLFYHGNVSEQIVTATAYNDNKWHYVVDTYSNGTETLYVDGNQVGSQQGVSDVPYGAPYAYFIGTGQTNSWPAAPGGWYYFGGDLDELKMSNTVRSSDWIGTEYNNQSSPATFYMVSEENAVEVFPKSASLHAAQSQQFTATGACSSSVVWSMPAGAPGTLTVSGLYTAPSSIATMQTLAITATSPAGSTNSATLTLLPPVFVSVTPANSILTENQNQQFTAIVANSNNQAVMWVISPAGTGTVTANGIYLAPSTITAGQTVTITATSQEDSTKSASATITLATTLCASNGYGYQRAIVIDHTKVPNSDQINFPFRFNTTDSDLAWTGNGGHVTSSSGYDIFFSLDPNGQTKLDHELEEYNPAVGQVIAWIRIPTLSHATDTLVYVFYGNPNVTSPQQNPAGVWNSNYQAVYHLANIANNAATDSTIFANAGTLTSVSAAPGLLDGAGSFNGSTSFVEIPAADFPSFPTGVYDDLGLGGTGATSTPFSASVGVWFRTSSPGGLLTQVPGVSCLDALFGWCFQEGPTEPGFYDPGGWQAMLYVDDNGKLAGGGVTTTAAYNDNLWHFAAVTYATDGTDTLYVDGQSQGVSTQQFPTGYSPSYNYFIGTAYTLLNDAGNWNWLYFNGTIDEVNVTNTSLSGDWIQTEYNNQGSPATFYHYTTVRTAQVVPATADLYTGQTQQFAVSGTCNGSIAWSVPSGALGSLSVSGLYAAPGTLSSEQMVIVTATNEVTGAALGTATVTLLTPPQALTLSAIGLQPYQTGTTQSLRATILDQQGNPQLGVIVAFAAYGANSAIGNGTTNSNGIATFSYQGTNAGSDTIRATSSFAGVTMTSNTLSVAWVAPTLPARTTSVTLMPPPTLGAMGLGGAFTDNTGAVIEAVAIGASRREFIVPAGATQLQLGMNSEFYAVDGGLGFNVEVNGVSVAVPPTAMPWIWVARGLNTNYQYGIYNPSIQNGALDGSAPVVATANLTAGEIVSVAYESGMASANLPIRPLVNANGDQTMVTGVQEWQGTYFPTLYMTPASYPAGQPITFNALVTDTTGAPAPSVPVTLNITGANVQQLQATTDSTGTAAFLYTGVNAGTDTVEAQAYPAGSSGYTSGSSTVTWVNSAAASPGNSLALSLFAYVNNVQGYVALTADAAGNPVTNDNLGFYVWGVDNFSSGGTTDITGHAYFPYYHSDLGTYNLVAVETVNGNVVFSNTVSGQWSGPSTPPPTGNTITIGISAFNTVELPNALALNGTVTDSTGLNPTINWSRVSGPGSVTFANPQQAVTTASFSEVGIYVLELSASDASLNSGSEQFTVTVVPAQQNPQGWLGSPAYGSAVSGLVPITLAPGVTLQSGILFYYPVNDSTIATVLNSNTIGSGQIGTLDTTTLVNGSYWIQLHATDTSGDAQYSLLLVTVTGNYKPGRVTATVTDLVVPATGLAISIQRQYDSLNAGASSDFGYGWSLGLSVNLTVDPAGNVTFTLGGQRKTFYLTPQAAGAGWILGYLFPWYWPGYTPEAGLHGTLTDSGSNCTLDMLVSNGSLWACKSGGQYTPSEFIYTDPTGTSYTIGASGTLKSIRDLSGNGLAITANGITSTTGMSVPFVRDASNRITQITDPQGNTYQYAYDNSGNLASVTYPNTTQSGTICPNTTQPNTSTYTYDTKHLYTGGTDGRCNILPTTGYYSAGDVDGNGNSLNGRLKSVTDAYNETTSYAYDLATNTTTITYPPDAGGNTATATMVYDSFGMLLSSTDPLGHITSNVYDANHNLTSVTDPLGHAITYNYDSNGNKTSSTYPATATSKSTTNRTQYNQYSEPTSTTDELGNARTFNYDANYLPLSVTDSAGVLASFLFNANSTLEAGAIGYDIGVQPALASQFAYDASGNMAGRTDALGRATSYTYDSLGHKLSMTVPSPISGASDATTAYQYDAMGNLTQTAAPLGSTTGSQYDADGNKISDTDARGNVTTYQYDALNRLSKTTYPTQPETTTSRTYDFRSNAVDETDQAGNVTHHAYDPAGRQIAVTRGYGTSNASTTAYTYYDDGRKQSETDALGHTTSYTYDAAGRLIAVAGVQGNTQYGYDDAGNQTSRTDGNGHTTRFQYDARKRLVTTTYPDLTTVTNTYDGPGNLASVTDQAGNVVEYTYDAANQLKTVVQVNHPSPSNNTNVYGYDNGGNLIGLTDENGHTTQNAFDILYRPISKTLPDGALTETRQYDPAGNLVSLTHFNGKTTTYTHDALNRLSTRTPDPSLGEPMASFSYTATGKYLTSTAGDGTVNYAYDALDRLITKATPEGTLNYTYDAAGHVASIASSNPNGASASYTYDAVNRLSTVVDNRLGTTKYAYDPASNLTTTTYPNGFQSIFSYDALNRMTATASQVSGYAYRMGPTGNRTSVMEYSGRTINWTYDGIYRLTNETIGSDPATKNGSVSYGLDPVGNRLSESSSVSGINSGSFGYNADDELSTESYDANGNTLTSGAKSFTYDSENRLTSMNGGAVRLVYDAFGNRVAKTVNGVTTLYLVEDDVNPTGLPQVMEETVNGALQRVYTYGLQRISENQIVSNTWAPSFYGYDGAGSVRQLTNSAGVVTDTYDYDAFGNQVNSTGTTPNNYLYRGEQYDPDLALYYLRARYYNPNTGRFLSRDPEDGVITGPASLHKYAYAGGDPVNAVDPTGHDSLVSYGLLVSTIAIGAYTTVTATSIYTHQQHTWAGGQTIVGLQQLSCAMNAVFSGAAIALQGEFPEVDTVMCTAYPKKTRCGPGEELHHLLPQQFVSWFGSKGLDINSPAFLRCIPTNCHRGGGGQGLHSNQNGPGTNWNALWDAFKSRNPLATEMEVLLFLAELEQKFSKQLECNVGTGGD